MDREKKLKTLLGKVFDSCREGLADELNKAEFEQRRHDFVFHMTDWLSDLEGYANLAMHPEKTKNEEAAQFLIGFLYHVIPHLNAAGRLLLDQIPDAFADQHLAPSGQTA